MDRISKLSTLCTLSFLAMTSGALRAQAQDAPVAPPAAPTNPDAPPAEAAPPPELPSPALPSAAAFPSGNAPPSASSSPSLEAPSPARSAAFAPLPELPPKRRAQRAAKGASAAALPASADALAPVSTYPRSMPSNDSSEPENTRSSDESGVFGPFRIGLLVGTGLPDLLSLGGLVKVTRYFGVGANVGLIPTVRLSLYGDATVRFQEYDLYGHIFPFGGAFFLGAGVGYASVHGTLSNRYTLTAQESAVSGLASPVEIDSQGNVRTLVLTPQLGLLKTFGPGFTIGVDVGAQIPIAPSKVDFSTQVPNGVPPSLVSPNDDKVRSTLNSVGRTLLPTVNLKLGWLL